MIEPDASISLDQKHFIEMVTPERNAEKAMGKDAYELTEKQIAGKAFARSLYVAEDIKAGDVITEKNVKSVRPGFGLHPRYLKEILSKRINKDLVKGERLSLDDIQSH